MIVQSNQRISRREFVGAVAALAAAGVGGQGLADDKLADRYGGFTVGMQSYTFRNFDREQALKRIQALGLHYVELYQKHAPLQSTPEQIQAILRMCKDYEITPVAYGVQEFTSDHDKNKQQFEFGKMLGIKFFSANPKADSFDSLDKLCDEYKIGIAIHPHGPIGGGKLHEWYSAEIIMEAVKNHHPLIGSCLDTGHLIRAAQLGKKLDPAQQVRVMGARNWGMHLKDHDNETKTDVVYGKGVLDVPEVLKALKEVNFKGWISIEYEAHAENPSPDVEACLQVLRDAVKKVS